MEACKLLRLFIDCSRGDSVLSKFNRFDERNGEAVDVVLHGHDVPNDSHLWNIRFNRISSENVAAT
jgi:hypothetical protein